MKKFSLVVGIFILSTVLVAGPASAFSTTGVQPIRKIPVNAENSDTSHPGLWTSGGVYTKCGAIGVDAVFYNNSSSPHIKTEQQKYSISIQINIKGAWVQIAGSEVESYRPSHQHQRYEYDQNIHVGWHYKYRVLVTNHTDAPLMGTMWVNAAGNDSNSADHDVADCQ